MNEEFYQIVNKKKREIEEEIRQLDATPKKESLQVEHKRKLLFKEIQYLNQLYSYPLFVRIKQMTDDELEEYRRLKLTEEKGEKSGLEGSEIVSDDFPLLVQKLDEIINKNIHYEQYRESHTTEEIRQTLIDSITIMPHEYEDNYQGIEEPSDRINAQFYEIIGDDFMKSNKVQSLLYQYSQLSRIDPEMASQKEREIRAELGPEYENISLPTRMELNEDEMIAEAAHAFYKRVVREINQTATLNMQKVEQKNEQRNQLEEILQNRGEEPEMGYSNMR